eukprot:6251468-Pyramimonas_sp.AAC.1
MALKADWNLGIPKTPACWVLVGWSCQDSVSPFLRGASAGLSAGEGPRERRGSRQAFGAVRGARPSLWNVLA